MPKSSTMGIDVFYDEPETFQGGLRTKNNRSLDESFDSYESKNLHDVEFATPSIDPTRTVTLMKHVNNNYQKRMGGILKNSKNPASPKRRNTTVTLSNGGEGNEWRKCAGIPITKRTGILMVAAVVVILILTVSTTAIGHKEKAAVNNNSPSTPTANPPDDNSPADTPEETVPGSDKSDDFKSFVLNLLLTITPENILNDPTTPQFRSWQWLLLEDNEDADMHWKDTPEILLQRYGALVMDMHLRAGRPEFAVAQLNTPVCQWSGIQCNEDGLVRSIVWPSQALSADLPHEIKAFGSSLRKLDLGENELFGTLPDGLFDLEGLEYLYLHDNVFTGTLSPRFGNLHNLTHVYLGMNQFHGPFPRELADLHGPRKLSYLSLHKNDLSGPLPEGITFKMMYYLDLSYNRFTGPLPTSWGEGDKRMRHIRFLILNNNQFSGTIPESYPHMGNGRMELFHVGHNQLTGEVPSHYDNVQFLQSLEVHDNNFTEPLSQDICGLLVWIPPSSEMVNLRADCDICSCHYMCGPDWCYDK